MTATRIFTTLAVVFVLLVALVSVYGWMVVNDLEQEQNAEPEPVEEMNIEQPVIVAEGLAIPWDIAFLPDGSMLVTERAGRVLHIESGQSFTIEGVEHVGEGGLLGIALHPAFVENNYVYLYQTTRTDGGLSNRIVRYVYQENELTFDRVVFSDIPGAQYHDGGRIAFGPDGMLYATVGDAQNEDAAQDPQQLHGSIIRLTDEGATPEDNPFGNAVYSYGHRNPQGLTWDDAGNLWSTEHGRSGIRSGYDEINLIQQGGNYGWPESEGDTVAADTIAPLAHSTANTTWAPASALYHNNSVYFGGLRGEALYEAILANGEVHEVRTHLEGEYGRIRSVVLGPDGFFYLTTSNRDGRGSPASNDDRIIRIDPRSL